MKLNQSKRMSGTNIEQMKLDHDLPFTMSHLTERFLSTESPLFSIDKENNGTERDGDKNAHNEFDDGGIDENGEEEDDADVDEDEDYQSDGSKLSGLQIDSNQNE